MHPHKLPPWLQHLVETMGGGGPLLLDAVNNGQADCGVNDVSAVSGVKVAGSVDQILASSPRFLPAIVTFTPFAVASSTAARISFSVVG